MKSICWAAGILLIWPIAMLAQKPSPASIKCKNVDGRGCTQRQVQTLSDAVFAGKSQHDTLIPVKDLELAASDGTLRCVQSDGSVCTTAELDIIKEIGSSQQLTIKYTVGRK